MYYILSTVVYVNGSKGSIICKWEAKARTAKTDMEEAGGRECEKSLVKDRGSWRSRCESNRGGDEVYPATFGNEKTELKLDKKKVYLLFNKFLLAKKRSLVSESRPEEIFSFTTNIADSKN